MRRAGIAVIGCMLLCACGGTEEEAEQAVRRMLTDAASARFQNVRQAGTATCGEVNATAPGGGQTGYRRFVAEGGRAWIEPSDVSAPPPDRTGCAEPLSYQSVEERFACAASDELAAAADRDADFAERWARSCG